MSLCDIDERLTIYVGYGNTVSIIPIADTKTATRMDMAATTQVTVCVGAVIASSLDIPAYVWWDQAANNDWVIHFQPGMFGDVLTGELTAMVVVYSEAYPDVLVLSDGVLLDIKVIC